MRVERSKDISVRTNVARAPARAPRWVVPAVKALLVLVDAFVAVACFCGAYMLREGYGVVAGLGDGGGPLVRYNKGLLWSTHFQPYAALLWFVVAVRVLSA